MQGGLRTWSVTVESLPGAGIAIGPMPAPMPVLSTGRNRSPAAPVGSRLRNTIRTGRSLVAAISGPIHCGAATPVYGSCCRVPSISSLYSGT